MNTRSSTKTTNVVAKTRNIPMLAQKPEQKTRSSTRISKQPEKFSDVQTSLNKGKYHGHYDRHQIQMEVSNYLTMKPKDDLHGYSGADGFVVSDQFVEQELSFDSDYDEDSVKSDDELEEQVDDEDLDLESDTSDAEDESDDE
jgi:hypothetical protein